MFRRFAGLLAAAALTLGLAHAQDELVIAFQGGAATLDPMMRNETTTISWQRHIFDNVTAFDRDGNVVPGIATSWENVDPTTWHFEIRQGVTFHDGTPMTAEDVAFSIDRAATHPMSEMRGGLSTYEAATALDADTVEVTTTAPDPLMPANLDYVRVIPAALIEEVGEEAFAENPVGTGPYVFQDWLAEDYLDLEANPDYWGGTPAYENVRLTAIPNGATRVAALLSGEVDMAVTVLPQDVPRVEASSDAYVSQVPGLRVIYLALDDVREDTPGMSEPNPFLDVRVRQAVFHAIDMDTIADRIMSGASTPASQFLAPFNEGYVEDLERPAYDPERARELLAEAGYEDGFTVRLDAPNDRYLNDALIAQAVGGQLGEVGIDVEVNAVPRAVFFPEHFNNGNSTMAISGWASNNTGATLNGIFHCWDEEAGLGRFNPFWYCNEEIDAMIADAITIFDAEERAAAFGAIIEKSQTEDVAYVPLHYQNQVVAVAEGLTFEARGDGYVFATDASPAN